jgi:hypothetical protein
MQSSRSTHFSGRQDRGLPPHTPIRREILLISITLNLASSVGCSLSSKISCHISRLLYPKDRSGCVTARPASEPSVLQNGSTSNRAKSGTPTGASTPRALSTTRRTAKLFILHQSQEGTKERHNGAIPHHLPKNPDPVSTSYQPPCRATKASEAPSTI